MSNNPNIGRGFRHIAVIGMGALGIMYGDLLARGLPEGSVTIVADAARTSRYRNSTVTANGSACSFEYATPGEFAAAYGAADLIIFAVKATALDAAIELARPIAGVHTVLLSLLNGISSEEIIEEALGRGTMVWCIGQGMDALRTGTAVTYMHKGVLCLGLPEATCCDPCAHADLNRLVGLFEDCAIPFVLEDDIVRRLWCKWMLNIGINQTVMVHEGTFKDVQQPGPMRDEFIAAMREVVAVAQKSGIDMGEADVDYYLKLAGTLNPDGMPSMRQDGLARRPSEVEIFSGTLIAKARALGVAVPVNESLYARVREMESHYGK